MELKLLKLLSGIKVVRKLILGRTFWIVQVGVMKSHVAFQIKKEGEREAGERGDRRKGQTDLKRKNNWICCRWLWREGATSQEFRRLLGAENNPGQTNQGELQSYNHMEPNSTIQISSQNLQEGAQPHRHRNSAL